MTDTKFSEHITIEGGYAQSISLAAGQEFRIVNIEGMQVVDVWAFKQSDTAEFLSNEHTRSCLEKLTPTVGDSLYSNRRHALLTVVADTSPGVHDLLLSACDIERYRLLGHEGYHRNCADNLRECAATLGIELADIPSPFNVFEHVRIDDQGGLSIQTPVAKAGDALTLRTETDLHLVFSACPMDIALTNGPDGRAKPVRVEFTASST